MLPKTYVVLNMGTNARYLKRIFLLVIMQKYDIALKTYFNKKIIIIANIRKPN